MKSIPINQRQEMNDERISTSDNLNEFQSVGITKLYNYAKKDDVVSDSGNSTAKNSKIIQSSTSINDFSTTKSKMAEITQKLQLNIKNNEKLKTKPVENNISIVDAKYNNTVKTKFDLVNDSYDEKQTTLNEANIKVLIESHFDSIKNKLEDNIKTKETIFRYI